ncbi:MAG TPA: hypothetical protein VJ890_21055, partial [Vineibacter sp.]|nr:hypothetical protein [Vineibacter sp.]
APAGLAVLDRDGRRAGDDHGVLADVAAALQAIAEALRDGRIDHRERAALAPLARDVGQALLGFADEAQPGAAAARGLE